MPDPYFFLCYSRADIQVGEPYVDRLFEDLCTRVAAVAGMGINHNDRAIGAKSSTGQASRCY